jgi:hypothetical protein
MIRFCSLACALIAGWGVVAAAQDGPVPTLRAYTNLVQIPVLVLDPVDRRPMPAIEEGRFFVSLNGGPMFRVTHSRVEGDDPISLAILLDLSQPFPNLMGRMDDAVAGLAPEWLRAADHVSIYAMDCGLVRSGANVAGDAAALRQAVGGALEAWRARGRRKGSCARPWHLWDSLAWVTRALSAEHGRRVIVAVTDGQDRGSANSWNLLRAFAEERGVAIFGMEQLADRMAAFRTASTSTEANFTAVCDSSGGTVLTASEKDIAEQMRQLMALVRGRYILEFPHPVSTTGGYIGMRIAIEGANAIIRSTGIGVPVDDPAVLNDPTVIPADPSLAPQLGKKEMAPE